MDEVLKIAIAGPMPAAHASRSGRTGGRGRDGRRDHSLTHNWQIGGSQIGRSILQSVHLPIL